MNASYKPVRKLAAEQGSHTAVLFHVRAPLAGGAMHPGHAYRFVRQIGHLLGKHGASGRPEFERTKKEQIGASYPSPEPVVLVRTLLNIELRSLADKPPCIRTSPEGKLRIRVRCVRCVCVRIRRRKGCGSRVPQRPIRFVFPRPAAPLVAPAGVRVASSPRSGPAAGMEPPPFRPLFLTSRRALNAKVPSPGLGL
jgi:hypothetical protein